MIYPLRSAKATYSGGNQMNRRGKLHVVARFQPGVVDDLMPELAKVVGREKAG